MKTIEAKLKIHTPWCRMITKKLPKDIEPEQFQKVLLNLEKQYRIYKCGDLCDIEINDLGNIRIKFNNNCDMYEAAKLMSIIIYFISICNGFNCEYDKKIKIDGKQVEEFISFPKEDKYENLFKDIKFYEISLEEISDKFGDIIYNLYSHKNDEMILSMLANYYSMVFYKDFIGNAKYKYRNIITNLESLITIINKDVYEEIINTNKSLYKELTKEKGKKINKYTTFRTISLQDKLKDLLKLVKNLFGLSLNDDINKETLKLANTRNFISHLFDIEKEYLSIQEIDDYTTSLQEIFRMIFLYHVGIDALLIKRKFLQNGAIRLKLGLNFNF